MTEAGRDRKQISPAKGRIRTTATADSNSDLANSQNKSGLRGEGGIETVGENRDQSADGDCSDNSSRRETESTVEAIGEVRQSRVKAESTVGTRNRINSRRGGGGCGNRGEEQNRSSSGEGRIGSQGEKQDRQLEQVPDRQ